MREAKESLSSLPRVAVAVSAGEEMIDVELTRGEFEELIRSDLERTVSVLEKTVREAGVSDGELAAVYLTGGSSRVPLAAALASEVHPNTHTRLDPKTLVALGASGAGDAGEVGPVIDDAEAHYRRGDERGDERGDGLASHRLGVLLSDRGDLEGAEAAWPVGTGRDGLLSFFSLKTPREREVERAVPSRPAVPDLTAEPTTCPPAPL